MILLFATEEDAKSHLVARRWPAGVTCPRCGNAKVWALKARPFNWLCKSGPCLKASTTGYRFSLYVGTILENTHYPLTAWFKALYLMLESKNGLSALQIQRVLDMKNYRTAWYLGHRLRAGLADPDFRQLMGVVAVDETFIGETTPELRRSGCVQDQQEDHAFLLSSVSGVSPEGASALPCTEATGSASQAGHARP